MDNKSCSLLLTNELGKFKFGLFVELEIIILIPLPKSPSIDVLGISQNYTVATNEMRFILIELVGLSTVL